MGAEAAFLAFLALAFFLAGALAVGDAVVAAAAGVAATAGAAVLAAAGAEAAFMAPPCAAANALAANKPAIRVARTLFIFSSLSKLVGRLRNLEASTQRRHSAVR